MRGSRGPSRRGDGVGIGAWCHVPLILALVAATSVQAQPTAADAGVAPEERRDERMRGLDGRLEELTSRALQARARMLDVREAIAEAPAGAARPGADEAPVARARRRLASGEERLRAGDGGEASVLLRAAVDSGQLPASTELPVALLRLGEALRQQGLWVTALGYDRRVLEHPASPAAREALPRVIEAEMRLGNEAAVPGLVGAARRSWGELGLPPEALYLAGKAAFQRRDGSRAERDREALATLATVPRPYEIAAAYVRGALRLRAGDLWGSVREFEACELFPAGDARQKEQRARCWLALARIQVEKQGWKEAIRRYDQVLRESPRLEEARLELATTHARAGAPDEALRVLEKIQAGEPGSTLDPEVELLRARLLTRMGRYPEAVESCERVRRRLAPARDGLDVLLATERPPGRDLVQWMGAVGDGRGGTGAPPPWVLAWARGRGDVGRGLDQVRRLEAAEKLLVEASADLERAGPAVARSGNEALQARLAEVRRLVAETGEALGELRGEVRGLGDQQARRALLAVRGELDLLVLRADRGIVESALARHADAQGSARSLLFRHAAEDRLPGSAERRRAGPASPPGRGPAVEDDRRRTRAELIALLEDYLRRHPQDPAYAPRALAVLAELQYEKASEGTTAADPGGCGSAIELYQRLAGGFPDFGRKEDVYFLLGYCLAEVGRRDEALQAYRDLVQKFPRSLHVPEAWVRIGDLSFEDPGPEALERTVRAYQQLSAWPDHRLYPHALYMLGWTWYRADDLQRAVEVFTKLLDHQVELARATGERPTGELWGEALRYVAASFANPRWEGLQKAREWSARVKGRPYEAAVYVRLGDQLLDQGRHPAAVEAYQRVIELDPLAPEAPRIQARIVLAWSREQRPDEQARERDVLFTTYDESGPWWRKNQESPEIVKEVRELRRGGDLRAATLHHARAQELQKAGRAEAAVAAFQRAAQDYARHLEASPDARDLSEVLFAWADAAYQGGDPGKAAQLYERVRDDPSSTAHREEAALDAVLSWEAEVARARKAGSLEDRKVVLAKDRQGTLPRAEPLPAPLAALVRASDAFVEHHPRHERAPAVAYRAGEIHYAHGQMEEARRRLEDVVVRWPGTEVSRYAANLIVETHLAARDWVAVERAAARLQESQGGRDPALASSMQKVGKGGRFNRAQQLMEQKQWEPAAELFLALAADDPKGELADKALYNAAFSLESARRLDRALPLYAQLQASHPGSPLAPEALFRVAWSAESLFDFERAAGSYLRLVDAYPGSKQAKDALFNAARALENLERHDAAATAFGRYARTYPGAEDAARAQLRAAVLHERARAWAKEIRALEELVARFPGAPHAELRVQAFLRMGLARRELGQERPALKDLGSAVAEFQGADLKPEASPAAAAAAAESQFRIAEAELEKFDRITLPATTSPQKLQKPLEAKLAELKRVALLYGAVKGYKRPDWTIAAFYRQAYLLERLAQTLYDAPVPPEFRRRGQEEYLAAYQDELARFARPYEEQAVQVYVEALGAARELHVKSEWTARIQQSLARHRPTEYPPVRQTRGLFVGGGLPPGKAAEEVEREARRAIAAQERDVPAMVALAAAFRAQGRLEAARTVLESARQAAPGEATVWNGLGLVELALGRRPQALESWRRAAELRPEYAEAQVNHGQLLVETGDFPGAVRALELAVKHSPASAPAWLDLGNAHRGAGRLDEAQRAYERALAVDPGTSDAWFDLGVLWLDGERSGMTTVTRLEKAVECLDRFAAAGGQDPALPAYRAEAQSLLEKERRRLAREAQARADGGRGEPEGTGGSPRTTTDLDPGRGRGSIIGP